MAEGTQAEEDREICSFAWFDINDQRLHCEDGAHYVSVAAVVRAFNYKYGTARVIDAINRSGREIWELCVIDNDKAIKIKGVY